MSNIDVGPNSFVDTNNLDKIRFEGAPMFRAPTLITRGRQVILDEITLRAQRSRRWRRLLPEGISPARDVEPKTVAATYRALRKSREDKQDAPGGADFYFGEMEMRRIGSPWRSADRWLLEVYRLASGYSLRVSRALVALVLMLAAGGVVMDRFGFEREFTGSAGDAALLLAQIALAISRTPEGMTTVGTVTVIAARLLVPALLALAILGLRNRVRR